jgi:polyisoprenyl-teichoic acid--peptidoglycan teichoic acid transferase
MPYFKGESAPEKVKFYRKKWFKIVSVIALIFIIGGGVVFWKTGSVLNKISSGNVFSSLLHAVPGVKDELKSETDGRINVLLLGMRGEDDPSGGLLADTIMVVSIKPLENKVAMISVPRDLYVTVPGTQDKQKINAVHLYGEERGKGQGLELMKQSVGEVLGLEIQYAASINFEGFVQLIDSIGGLPIYLDNSFVEPLQFRGVEGRCDGVTFVVPSGNIESKKVTRKNGTFYFHEYALCFTKNPSECGGKFELSAGNAVLTGEQALCFSRSRVTSSDFERAKRQQIILQKLKDQLLSIGTLTDFGKVNGVLNSLGNNVKTDLELWEMKRFFDVYKGMGEIQIYQRVLENSEEGFLYNPEESNGAGYILLPRGDNYDRIHEMAANIFTLPPQSDIKPK